MRPRRQAEMLVPESRENPGVAFYAGSVTETLKLKGRVEIVPPGSLPNDGKVIEDLRSYD